MTLNNFIQASGLRELTAEIGRLLVMFLVVTVVCSWICCMIYRVAQKSKLLILAVNEINASQTRVSFAKFIPKLVEKMFVMCSIVPNYSFSILNFFIKILSCLLMLPIITI